MTLLIALTLSLASPSVPGDPTGAPQTEESVLAAYDLRGVMPRWDATPSWSQTLMVPPVGDPRAEQSWASPSYGELANFELLDLLTQILGDELRREGREIMVERDELTVLAPEAIQEQVRTVLEALRLALSGTIPVRVDALVLGEGAGIDAAVPANILSDEEAARLVSTLVSRGAVHKSFLAELSAGRTAWIDARRRIPYVLDFDVEIAQSSVVFDPIEDATYEGTRIGLHGLPVDGGLFLSVVVQRSDLLGAIASQQLDVTGRVGLPLTDRGDGHTAEFLPGPGTLQTPDLLARGLAFDTLLADGKALAVTIEADLGGRESREVLVVRRLGGSMTAYVARPIPRTNRTLIALNSELFRRPRLISTGGAQNDGWGVPGAQVVAHFEDDVPGFLLEWLKVRFSIWRRFGPWMLIVTDPAWDRDAAAELDRLVKSRRSDDRVVVLGVDLRAQGRSSPLPVRVRVPVLQGSCVGLMVGRGMPFVAGYDVEVAQNAAVPDPAVSVSFEGLAMSVTLEPSMCETSGLAQLLDGPITAFDPGYALLGPIQRPEPRFLRFDERLLLAEGAGAGRARVGVTSERTDEPGLTVELSFSAR